MSGNDARVIHSQLTELDVLRAENADLRNRLATMERRRYYDTRDLHDTRDALRSAVSLCKALEGFIRGDVTQDELEAARGDFRRLYGEKR